MTIVNNSKTALSKTDNTKQIMKFVQERSQTVDKSLADILMSSLTIMKYDGLCNMHEHVLDMTTLEAKSRTSGMKMDEYFLVQFIFNSLPPEHYRPLQINYNIVKDKWDIDELNGMLV